MTKGNDMKATIENGVLWVGSETHEEILATNQWMHDNAEGIKLLKQDHGTTIQFVGIVLEKNKPPKKFRNKIINDNSHP